MPAEGMVICATAGQRVQPMMFLDHALRSAPLFPDLAAT
jgi:hypothetical protein